MNELTSCRRIAEIHGSETNSSLVKGRGLNLRPDPTASHGLAVNSLRMPEGAFRAAPQTDDLYKRPKQAPYRGKNANHQINPDFTVVRSDYRVRLASEETHLHSRARKLVESMYGSCGLMTAKSTPLESPAQQVTLAASSGERVFGTLTLGVDSGAGLLADMLYGKEIDQLREQGRKVCEVTRLAIDPALSCPEVMATIFNVAFVLATKIHARTDLIAEVHPRHASFYQRTMGYRVAGPVRTCDRVSAPAVLMHLCLDFATTQIRELAGTAQQGDRSLYRLFLPPAEQDGLLTKIIAQPTAANSMTQH